MIAYRKVLDIDLVSEMPRLRPRTKDFIMRAIVKMSMCEHNITLCVSPSSLKGYHVVLFCKKDCDICRMCYDDDRHLAYDMNRPEYARNILFHKKERVTIE